MAIHRWSRWPAKRWSGLPVSAECVVILAHPAPRVGDPSLKIEREPIRKRRSGGNRRRCSRNGLPITGNDDLINEPPRIIVVVVVRGEVEANGDDSALVRAEIECVTFPVSVAVEDEPVQNAERVDAL